MAKARAAAPRLGAERLRLERIRAERGDGTAFARAARYSNLALQYEHGDRLAPHFRAVARELKRLEAARIRLRGSRPGRTS